MSTINLLDELAQVKIAIELIELGARLQVLESEVELKRARLVRLYKEVSGSAPPKGMLPFSTDWFMTWQPNIHASMFYMIYKRLRETQKLERIDSLIKAYKLYQEQNVNNEIDDTLSLTRAWTLIRFFESGLLQQSTCTKCNLSYVNYVHTPDSDYVCGICEPPSRAGIPASGKNNTDMNKLAVSC